MVMPTGADRRFRVIRAVLRLTGRLGVWGGAIKSTNLLDRPFTSVVFWYILGSVGKSATA